MKHCFRIAFYLTITSLVLVHCSYGQNSSAYRDLNKNGKKDIYEDPNQPVNKRLENLLQQMTIEEKAGLLFNAATELGIPKERALADSLVKFKFISSFGMPGTATAKESQEINNSMQKLAEETRLGIPITFFSDPRQNERYNEAAGKNRYHSRWPTELGFGAINDANLVREFANISRQEYLALGIRLALHPMADLATEPRWFRTNSTFGEDAGMSAKLTSAYITGFQGEHLNKNSVLCMTKHFPGGGPQKDGYDAHFEWGKDQVYPGKNFNYHLKPFIEGAIPAGTAQIMLYYGRPLGVTKEEVGFGFNREIAYELLRKKIGFKGVISTDWGLVSDYWWKKASAWGVENLSRKERVKKILDAGVDMLGGEDCQELIVELVKEGSITESRIDSSVRRILYDKFIIGLFDNPYVSEEQLSVFKNSEYKEKGKEAQRRSFVLLKNENNILPLRKGIKVFVKGIEPNVISEYANIVYMPEEADVILFKFETPYTPKEDTTNFILKFIKEGRLDFPDKEKSEILNLINKKPTVSIINFTRPPVIPEINNATKALIADFECEDAILAELIFGKFKPTGKLPIEMPSSMQAVLNQFEDVPRDSKKPLYPFGYGITYK